MIRVFLLFIKNCFGRMFRHLFWLYKLSTSDLGNSLKVEFPVIREGKGSFKIGKNSFLGKNCRLGVGESGKLIFGDNTHIESESTMLVNKNCSLITGNNFKLGDASRLFVQNNWQFGNNVKIETNCSIFAREPKLSGKLFIGNDSNIGDFTLIDLVDDLTIGNDVAIGPNCTIYTHDHIYTDLNKPAWKGGTVSKPIIIKDGAWVGSGVTILPGIVIGERAVVAAGSIVTKDVDSNCIYGGNPAKLIKKITV
jgi:acetyltransferase-like isoleucine patch superfamily enzyme